MKALHATAEVLLQVLHEEDREDGHTGEELAERIGKTKRAIGAHLHELLERELIVPREGDTWRLSQRGRWYVNGELDEAKGWFA